MAVRRCQYIHPQILFIHHKNHKITLGYAKIKYKYWMTLVAQQRTVSANDSRRCRYCLTLDCYIFLRLATPIKPINPEPNNQTAAGTGTALTSPSRTAQT